MPQVSAETSSQLLDELHAAPQSPLGFGTHDMLEVFDESLVSGSLLSCHRAVVTLFPKSGNKIVNKKLAPCVIGLQMFVQDFGEQAERSSVEHGLISFDQEKEESRTVEVPPEGDGDGEVWVQPWLYCHERRRTTGCCLCLERRGDRARDKAVREAGSVWRCNICMVQTQK